MPIECPRGQKPRYRWVGKGKDARRLAFCGNEVVEVKKKGGVAHKAKKRK